MSRSKATWLLDDVMNKRGFIPWYDRVLSPPESPFYQYELEVSNIRAIGRGKTREEGMCAAARRALDQICDMQEDAAPLHQKELKENAEWQLRKLCQQNSFEPPKFKFIYNRDRTHKVHFIVTCDVNALKEIRRGQTLKEAKMFAASAMLNTIQVVLGRNSEDCMATNLSEPMPAEEPKSQPVGVFHDKEDMSTMPAEEPKSQPVGVFYEEEDIQSTELIGKVTVLRRSKEVMKLNETNINDIPDARETLQRIISDIGATVRYIAVPGTARFSTLLSVSTPDFATWGSSMDTQEASDISAAKSALEYIQLITRVTP